MRSVVAVLLPATLASGMLQIATYTDLYFASFMPGAAAAMGYANLLAMAPLGILSSSILVPILPRFASLARLPGRDSLRREVIKALGIAIGLGLPLAAVLIPLAGPIVRLVFERRAFDAAATHLVAQLMVLYVAGSPVYLLRDVLLRAFYAIGDGRTPMWVSLGAIVANVVLDYAFVFHLNYGAPGLVVATVLCNALSACTLLAILQSKLGAVRELGAGVRSVVVMTVSAGVSAVATYASYSALRVLSQTLVQGLHGSALVTWLAEAALLGVAAAGLPWRCGAKGVGPRISTHMVQSISDGYLVPKKSLQGERSNHFLCHF
ncbi:hypothetical protein CYMTET_32381 [Cymbomonas tetramitiformis]|uniref:Uncharacterized protein n=1 Tax=Cymbomonas tetramitiformis TaxID=36881 RepID=A0AAE0FF66_9CHLO|nr:hypothetical protein CYMTET_32381 [Cymbomonas tetramitiformis]